jgi:hypothetical protein
MWLFNCCRAAVHCEQNQMITKDLELLRGNVRRLKANQRSAEDAGFAFKFAFGRHRPGMAALGVR